MAFIIILLIVLVIILLTVLPGWLRKRRMGEDYDTNYDPAGSVRERRAKVLNWKQQDHTGDPTSGRWRQ